jgi:hypothetical protein
MPGGPINGGLPIPILIPTVLQIAQDAVNYWTHLTCLYDPYWGETDKVTLPICFFNVKEITRIRTNEISKQRVILYTQQKETIEQHAEPMREGEMQTVVDNMVKNPLAYQIEAIVPYQPIGRYISDGAKGVTDTVTALAEILGLNTFASGFESVLAVAHDLGALGKRVADAASSFPGADGSDMINMNSLEAMADSNRVLCMKMWTGYDYRYVAITGMSDKKAGTEDDVFRVTLQLQEMPVLSITEPKPPLRISTALSFRAKAIRATYKALAWLPMKLTQVDSKNAGGPLKQ